MSDSQEPPVFGRRKDPVAAPFASAGNKLASLLRTPVDKRDGRWNHEFAGLVADACFLELYPELVSPEGHRVYAVTVAETGQQQAMKFSNLVKKATKAGHGIAIFTDSGGMEPAFVFKQGQLTPVIAHGALMPLGTRPAGETGESGVREGATVITANPSPTVLPEATRAALRDWLARCWELDNVRIILRMDFNDPGEAPVKTLGVLFGRNPPPDAPPRELMLGIYWYLPPDVAAGYFSHAKWNDYFPL